MTYRIVEILGNRYAGLILCPIVILNLAAGSLLMTMNPESSSPFSSISSGVRREVVVLEG